MGEALDDLLSANVATLIDIGVVKLRQVAQAAVSETVPLAVMGIVIAERKELRPALWSTACTFSRA